MAELYIMSGLPFAGKSTITKALIHRFGFSLVATDEIYAERGLGIQGAVISQQEWEATYKETYQRIEQLLRQGKNVIYDDCNFTKIQRDTAREIAQQQHAKATAIYVNTSKDEVVRRWQQNRRSNQRVDVRDEDFAQVADNFQVPTEDEDVIVYNNSLLLEKWIERYFNESRLLKDTNEISL